MRGTGSGENCYAVTFLKFFRWGMRMWEDGEFWLV